MMGVVLIRVDSRLIHGQILEAWIPHTRADALLVVDDGAYFSRALARALPVRDGRHLVPAAEQPDAEDETPRGNADSPGTGEDF